MAEPRVSCERRGDRVAVLVTIDDNLVYSDVCDPFSRRSRETLVNTMLGKYQGMPHDDLDHAILRAAATVAEVARNDTGADGDPAPWDHPVTGETLAKDLFALVKNHVILGDHDAVAVVLWIIHSYCFATFHNTPRLLITGPDKRCGKSLLLRIIASVVSRPLRCGNITAAALFRSIDAFRPTLLLDEADTYLLGKHVNEDLRGVINEGHSRTGCVVRCVGDDHAPRKFPVFAPMAIAMINRPPATIEDRSVTIVMRRKSRSETATRLPAGCDLRERNAHHARQCIRWVGDNKDALAKEPEVLPELDDRAADNWYPLLAIADAIGGDWPSRARAAASSRQLARAEDDSSDGVRLLDDLRSLFVARSATSLPSAVILDCLTSLEESPWPDFGNGRGLRPPGLARLLKPYGVRPRNMKLSTGKVAKGYFAEDLRDPWDRYVPTPSGTTATALPTFAANDLRAYAAATAAATAPLDTAKVPPPIGVPDTAQ